MKNTTIALRRIAITTGLLLGSFALAAMAGSWSAPGSTPPNGNVDAPINVGSSFQEKLGTLMVHGLSINGGFLFNPGGSISAGQVLTAKDSIGTVGWTTLATGGEGGGGGNTVLTGSVGGGCYIGGGTLGRLPVCWGNGSFDNSSVSPLNQQSIASPASASCPSGYSSNTIYNDSINGTGGAFSARWATICRKI